MNRRILCFLAAVAFVFVSASMSMAENAILVSLENQGVSMQMMDDATLDTVRGAAVIYNQVLPSTTTSVVKHHVTWKHFGSQADYRSYNYVGASFVPNTVGTYNGYYVVGDQYLADTISTGTDWSLANSFDIDNHLQVFLEDQNNPGSYYLSNAAFRDTSWNRPLGTFTW